MNEPEVESLSQESVFVPVLTETEKELLITPVDEIAIENLFIPVPLTARLASANVSYVKELALMQREQITKAVVGATTTEKPASEIRFNEISGSGVIAFKFTEPIDFPAGT